MLFFFLKKRGQAGQGAATTHPALMVPKEMKSSRVGGLLLFLKKIQRKRGRGQAG